MLCLVVSPLALAQISSSGTASAINTPIAQVTPWGYGQFQWTNNLPERQAPALPSSASNRMSNLAFGAGVLPGAELGVRLAVIGRWDCWAWSADCTGMHRDLSLSAKYQLPVQLPWGTRVALGLNDFGGAATSYRNAYGVASLPVGDWLFSAGYGSRPQSRGYGLLNGAFGSVVWQAGPELSFAVEHDSDALRVGAFWAKNVTDRLRVNAGLSQRVEAPSSQKRQAQQFSVGLQYSFQKVEKVSPHLSTNERDAAYWASGRAATSLDSSLAALNAGKPATSGTPHVGSLARGVAGSAPMPNITDTDAQRMLTHLEAQGFTGVDIGEAVDEPQHWVIKAETTRWRQNAGVGLGAAIGAWFSAGVNDASRLSVTTTYMGREVLTAQVSAGCVRQGLSAGDACAVTSDRVIGGAGRQVAMPASRALVHSQTMQRLHAEFELAPAFHYTFGTEYGVYDYALGLDLGWQVGVPGIDGLMWQGVYTHPGVRSSDFEPGHVFADREIATGVQSAHLTYLGSPMRNIWVQAHAGYMVANYYGVQVDGQWLSESRRWGIGATGATYQHKVLPSLKRRPHYAELSYAPVVGRWTLGMTAGEFLNGDRGYKLNTHHQFGDNSLNFFYRKTASPDGRLMPKTAFAGFQVNFPLGPNRAAKLGPVTLRGRDEFSLGLTSKVQERDNRLTYGYGVLTKPRHGLKDLVGSASTGFYPSSAVGLDAVQEGLRQTLP